MAANPTPNEQFVRNVTDNQGTPYFTTESQTAADQNATLLDRHWIKQAFLVSDGLLENNVDVVNRYWSSASAKFTTAVIGNSIGINNRPQFTRYADIRVKGVMPGRTDVSLTSNGTMTVGQFGMGRYYSEAIDDNAQKIFMRFGVPQYNSLTGFIMNAASADAELLARTGRATSTIYDAAKLIGGIGMFVAFPVASALIYGGKALYNVITTIFDRPTSKFYNLKPTMELYWSTVNTLVNTIGVNKGLLPASVADATGGTPSQKLGNAYQFSQQEMQELSNMFPGIVDSSGYFDVYAIAARPQAMANALFETIYDDTNLATPTKYTGYINKQNANDPRIQTQYTLKSGNYNIMAAINERFKFTDLSAAQSPNSSNSSGIEIDPRTANQTSDPNTGNISAQPVLTNANSSFIDKYKSYMNSQFRNGAQFACFQVDYTGSVSESFSNSATESDLQNKINSMSSEAREARFTFANGDIVGSFAKKVIGAAGDVITGALSGLTYGLSDSATAALGILAGNGYVDIPKHWQSSSASLPRSTYTMQLTTPYNNVISQMMNLYIPLCMILAGALPLSTGKQSYTSPFLVELWDRGRSQIRLGMIESLSVTRGVSNLGFSNMGSPLAIDVSFSVMDLSSIMHMPVSTGSLFNPSDMTLDADNILRDYLAVLAGQDIYSQFYALPRAKLNLAKMVDSYKKFTSPAYWAQVSHSAVTGPISLFNPLFPLKIVGNGIEGVVQGNSVIVNPISNAG